MKTARPIGAALLLAGGAAGALYVTRQERQQSARHTLEAEAAVIPRISLATSDARSITRLELSEPGDDASAGRIVLEKRADTWLISSPVTTTASAPKVQALLDNLQGLKLSDAVDSGPGYYERYDLTDAKAFHVVAWKDGTKLTDLYFGKSSARGELVRVGGVPGVFSIASSGPGSYSGFLYTRPLRSWRETSILRFSVEDAVALNVTNRHGAFYFERGAAGWSGSRRLRHADGKLGNAAPGWPRFDASQVLALLQVYHSLSADEFGAEEDRAGSGLDQAEHTGGVIAIRLKDDSELRVRVGELAHGPSSWGIKDSRWAMKDGGDGTLYALSLWTADWATADDKRFELAAHAQSEVARSP
jgi:hypothetical protein